MPKVGYKWSTARKKQFAMKKALKQAGVAQKEINTILAEKRAFTREEFFALPTHNAKTVTQRITELEVRLNKLQSLVGS